jgi:hypothetical protein
VSGEFGHEDLAVRGGFPSSLVPRVEGQVEVLQALQDLGPALAEPHAAVEGVVALAHLLHDLHEHLEVDLPLSGGQPFEVGDGGLLVDPRRGVGLVGGVDDVGGDCEEEELAQVHGLTLVVDAVEGGVGSHVLLLLAVEVEHALQLPADHLQVLTLPHAHPLLELIAPHFIGNLLLHG